MSNVSIHDNHIYNCLGGEGVYIGKSNYTEGHDLNNVLIYSNHVHNTGWDGIQLGCALDSKVYDNTVENFGKRNEPRQRNDIQIEGTSGVCTGNLVQKGKERERHHRSWNGRQSNCR